MEDNELQIVLSLVDKASAELKRITGEIKGDMQGVEKESKKATASIDNGFKQAGKELKEFRRNMFAVTATIALIAGAVKAWGDRNSDTNNALRSLSENSKKLFSLFGSLFAPAVIALSDLIQKNMAYLEGFFKVLQDGYTKLFETITFGIQYAIAFFAALSAGSSIQQAHADATQAGVRAMEQMSIQFQKGYNEDMPRWAQSYKQMKDLEERLRDESYMDAETDIQARIGLLKTLEAYHHTAYSTMMDFTRLAANQISTGMSTALTSIIMKTQSAREAFTAFGEALLTTIIEFFIRYAIESALAFAFSTAMIAANIGQAAAVGAAWALPAALVSLATLGANAIPAAAGIAAVTGLTVGLAAASAAGSAATGGGVAGAGGGGGGGGGFAEGGWIPEPIWGIGSSGKRYTFGERGPEYVVPNDKLGGTGQTYINIEINNPYVRSNEDIEALTQAISTRLAYEAERI